MYTKEQTTAAPTLVHDGPQAARDLPDPDPAALPATRDRTPAEERARVAEAESLGNARLIVRQSAQVDQLFAALAKAQAMEEYGDIEKTKTARVTSRKGEGSSYTYEYETLSDVLKATRPYLAQCGIATMQFPFPGERSVTIRTMLAHSSGQWIYNDLSALIPMPDPQAVGSGISYLRRYALKAITGVASRDEDDDAQAASQQRQAAAQDVKPAPRKSERKAAGGKQEGAAEPAPAPTAPAPAPGALSTHKGAIKNLEEARNGSARKVMMDDGTVFGVMTPELITIVESAWEHGLAIEAKVKQSSDPAKYVAVATKIALQRQR